MTLNWQALPPPETADQLANTITNALNSGDIPPNEHGAFMCGYIGGITYCLAKLKEPGNTMADIHNELTQRIQEAT